LWHDSLVTQVDQDHRPEPRKQAPQGADAMRRTAIPALM